MKAHGLLLNHHAGGAERRHDGRIAVDERNRRWCSDGLEIGRHRSFANTNIIRPTSHQRAKTSSSATMDGARVMQKGPIKELLAMRR